MFVHIRSEKRVRGGRKRGKEERELPQFCLKKQLPRTHNSSSITHEIVQSKIDTCLDICNKQEAGKQPDPFWKIKIKEQMLFKLPHDTV